MIKQCPVRCQVSRRGGLFLPRQNMKEALPPTPRVVSDRTTPKRLAPAAFFFIHAGSSELWEFARCAVSHRLWSVGLEVGAASF